MFTGLVIVASIASILLVLIVLAQNPKGGITSQLSASSNVLGVKKTTDFLEKATWGLAVTVILVSVAASKYATTTNLVDPDSTLKDALNSGKSNIEQIDESRNTDFDLDDVEAVPQTGDSTAE